ncbi:hypothetical protein GCM10023116_10250 [Kistimonas scapharcae]|uniref:Structural protein P5 n=1 Tax=Kistimonas scapharcae TaxID=1036133 RepID=A0ABP8V1K7_9GAMM
MLVSHIRGFRNCNPGNIRHGESWQGLQDTQTDKAFCQFVSHEFGIRAMSRTLRTYYHRHELRTVREFINRWAPPNENNTDAYVEAVAARLGLPPDFSIDNGIELCLPGLIRAIIHHELGCQPYSEWLIDEGIRWDRDGIPGNTL